MAKKKVLLITGQVINERNYERFSLNLLNQKYDFTILDLSYIFNKESYFQNFNNKIEISNYHFVKSLNDLNNQSFLLENSDLLIGLIGQENEITSKIYNFIKPYEHKLCVVLISAFPVFPLKMKFFVIKRIITKFNREKSFLGILKKLSYIITRRLINKKKNLVPGYFLVCGTEVAKQYKFDTSKAKIIKSCSYDYVLSKNNYDNLVIISAI